MKIDLEIGKQEAAARPVAIRMNYRHVNQGETWCAAEMQARDGRWGAVIPATYTQSQFALEYFFELRDGGGQAWLYPGFEANLCNQPYFAVRQG